MGTLSILRPGIFTTVQDLGRWGFQSRGVPVSGALDWYSHRLANLLAGNDEKAATLEVTLTGPDIRFEDDMTVGITGAEFSLTLDGVPVAMNRAIDVKSGSVLKLGDRAHGARAYLAVAGGIDVPEVLGSRSTHVLTRMGGFNGRALKTGDALLTAARGKKQGATDFTSPLTPRPLPLHGAKLRLIPGDARLAAYLTSRRFRVTPQSDRMGFRLEGDGQLEAPPAELISVAVPTGAVQVPPRGQPILLMNDHATTGGYAIGGVVITSDLPAAGQLAPGDWVEFDACSIEAARAELRRTEVALGAG